MDNEIETGSGNVYADLGFSDAEEMLIKAELALAITTIIKTHSLTQAEAAKILGITQPKLSNLMRGQFRGISEAKMMSCLTRLGRDVEIVVSKPRQSPGSLRVVLA